MKLILMSTPYFFVEEHQILNALFDEGLELLHLRKPFTEPIYTERLLSLIPDNYKKRIVTHDHFYLKNEYGLKGIHLNQRNPELPNNYKGQLSCTCYNFDEIEKRKRLMDYVILTPVFGSEGQPSPFSPSELKEQHKKGIIDKRVFAQGNVSLDDIPRLKDYNFGGVVIIGDVWNKFDRYNAQDYRSLISHFRKLRKATL